MPPGAPMEDIERSFRELIKVWHPDRFLDNPALQIRATRKTSEITKSFQWLRRHEAFQKGKDPAPSTPDRVLKALRHSLDRFLDRNPATSNEVVLRAVRALLTEVSAKPQPERIYPFRWLRDIGSGKVGRVVVRRRKIILAWAAIILIYIFLGAR